jgi:hypothetical protein
MMIDKSQAKDVEHHLPGFLSTQVSVYRFGWGV